MNDQDPNPKPGHDTRDDEPVSALVDGELDARGAAFVIRRIAGDDGLSRRWHRFHIVRACLQGEFTGSVSMVSRVHAALADEASPAGRPRAASRLLRLAGGGAVAASVAMMAVVGLGNRVDQQVPATSAGADAPGFVSETTALDRQFSAPAVPAGFGGAGLEARRAGAAAEANSARARINRYVIRHSQAAGGSGFTSFTPVLTAPASVRVANPETSDTESGETGRERGE
jgi:sigma-E factor negative regulatory protein RseA